MTFNTTQSPVPLLTNAFADSARFTPGGTIRKTIQQLYKPRIETSAPVPCQGYTRYTGIVSQPQNNQPTTPPPFETHEGKRFGQHWMGKELYNNRLLQETGGESEWRLSTAVSTLSGLGRSLDDGPCLCVCYHALSLIQSEPLTILNNAACIASPLGFMYTARDSFVCCCLCVQTELLLNTILIVPYLVCGSAKSLLEQSVL